MSDDAGKFWEQRYGERDQIWSGKPNATLVDVVRDLVPGRALDLGCGEGGDSIWLAERGWRVTGVDVSATAIDRARAEALRRGVGEKITWIVGDLSTWTPSDSYELVSACFLHSPVEFPRSAVLERMASAVTSGGHFVLVGHAVAPPWMADHDGHHHRLLSAVEERESLSLDNTEWDDVVVETRSRMATGPNGEQATLDDSVVVLRRR
ncbi:MAG: methyltransferase domain-containing protein [Acidimicrobiales bacterium]